MGSIIFKTILGIIAGVVGWAVVEPFKPEYGSPQWGLFELLMTSMWGALIGGAVGFHSGLKRGSTSHAMREMWLGGLFGLIGIAIGKGLASPFAAMINMPGIGILGRALAIGCIGAGIGAGVGFSTFVTRRGIQGLIGGVIGGGIAGLVFDLVGSSLRGLTLSLQGVAPGQIGETGGPSRALTGLLLGGCIALMIGIIEALAKSAWIRLELGRNEGKEWVIDKPVMMIGRHERADIPLFGDDNVAPQHVAIHKQGDRYTLVDQGSPLGVGVNGQRVSQAVLQPNDVIQVGGLSLRFITKNVKAPARNPEAMRNMAYPIGGQGAAQYPQQGNPIQPAAMQPAPQQTQMYGAPMQPGPTGGQQTQMYTQTQMQGIPSQMAPTQAIPQQPLAQTQMYGAAPMSAGAHTLVATDGPLAGQRFTIAGAIELGRESAQVPMSFDGNASRRHARVEVSGPSINVSDLGSTNGTFLNGQRITNAIAKNGDILKVGATNFRIESQ
jgi:pSer/pThr/pTyr-binding forkhead associated (FHA) protein